MSEDAVEPLDLTEMFVGFDYVIGDIKGDEVYVTCFVNNNLVTYFTMKISRIFTCFDAIRRKQCS